MTGHQLAFAGGLRGRLQALVPQRAREAYYRFAGGAVMFLMAIGLLDTAEASLWTQLVVGTVTLVFALLYATTPWRVALYAITGPLGGVLMYYGIVNDTKWALITASVAQAFGITTAAAKTVQRRRIYKVD